MTPHAFIAKWKRAQLSERSAAQQHFLDLCDVLDQKKPAAADPEGAWYTFERGVSKSSGGKGWADVWMRGHFAWEYKGKHKDLVAAYQQLQLYREALENPPLLIVCDLDRFEIHTNFTNTAKEVFAFNLDSLAEPKNLDILRRVFTNPDSLKPQKTTAQITEEIAKRFSTLADGMRARDIPAQDAAHFLMKLMFCMFAEDVELLDDKLFTKILTSSRYQPADLSRRLHKLFQVMSTGGEFGADPIRYFNGGLFADADVINLTEEEIEELIVANEPDWSNVEPSIFGTLFERTLDPAKRSQIGAHYTSREDILTLLEPVLMAPLRREWEEVKAAAEKQWQKVQEANRTGTKQQTARARRDFDALLENFLHRLETIKILDPACGSGNFLYVAIHLLLDFEKQILAYGANYDFGRLPHVRPTQLLGIEINPYAQQLAQVVIWIGYLQWMHHNGYIPKSDPVLEPFENIQRMDAILDLTDPETPKEPNWPEAEFIVGNPPFLGSKKLRDNLGDEYTNALLGLYKGRVQGTADLCAYWFEKARARIQQKHSRRAGLLATQSIRGTATRKTLASIKETGNIFFGISDQDWVLDGASVHVSMVGFDAGEEQQKLLDGSPVNDIPINLTSGVDITQAVKLKSNYDKAFMGDTKGGAFEVAHSEAIGLLHLPNPNGRPNSDVLVPWANASDIAGGARDVWIIDFGIDNLESRVALYEGPFEIVRQRVLPERLANRRDSYREKWWVHAEPRPGMRNSLRPLNRFLVTTITSKYRLFAWMKAPTLPDHKLIAFAFEEDWIFGVLHSRVHRAWTYGDGSQVRDRDSGFTYIPTTNFMTFSFPEPTDAQQTAIADAASELDRLRAAWLNPPEWTREEILEFPGSVDGPWARFVTNPDPRGIGTVRYARLVPRDDTTAKLLEKRTLTNLYNERPTWLDLAHKRLDEAVFAAYGWKSDMSDEEILEKLLELNLSRDHS